MRCTTAAAIGTLCVSMLPAAITVPARAGAVVPLGTLRVASGLNRPVFVTHTPGDESRLFIVEQRGVIKILDLQSLVVLGTAFLNIDALVGGPASSNDERGLLGLAFHPDYDSNGFFYVNYINNASDTVLARYSVSGNPDVADAGSAVTILTIDQPQQNHNGGWIAFGPDGHLYMGTGDGGAACDTGAGHTAGTGNAQDLTANRLGKMLRIDPSTAAGVGGYSVPASNPFVGQTGDDEIWAYGLRNPWRSSFDRANGDLYIGDVGQDAREEIDYQPGTSTGRENYGWRCMEGMSCSSVSGCTTTGCVCNSPGLVLPIYQYTHGVGFCLTGGYVYRGCDIPSLDGTYFFADFVINHIWSFKVVGGSVTEFTERTSELTPSIDGFGVSSVASFGEDARGEIYIVDRGSTTTGEIFRIVPDQPIADFDCSGTVSTSDFLELLSHWGPCAGPVCPWDLDGDHMVSTADFLLLLTQWGPV